LRDVGPAGRPVETDVSAAAWIPASGWLLPTVFAAYARVLHPAIRYVGNDDVEVSWAEVAEENASLAHPLMQWPAITGGWEFVHEDDQSPLWDDSPAEGHLPATVAERLAALLRRHTATPDDCWFGVWNGFGWDAPVADVPAAPDPVLLGREYRLLRGPVELAATNLAPEPAEQSANIWWPADRAWCVVTDIDLMSTYVGGSTACIESLLAAPDLEVVPSAALDRVDTGSDLINPVPPRD
jgi:hypothetical protein